MNENEEQDRAAETPSADNPILDLTFSPSWARISPDAEMERLKGRSYHDAESAGDRDARRAGRDSGPREHRRDSRPDRPRRPHTGPAPEGEMPRPESHGAVVHFDRPAGGEARRAPFGGPRGPRPAPVPQLPVEVRVLPEQKALGAVIRRIQTAHNAFPLRDIACLFLDKPASCLIRIEPLKDQQVPLFQCRLCGLPATSEDEIRNHLIAHHFDEFFDVEEVDCEPPTGSFSCVARCSLSGELIGPPNHHSFNAKIQEMLRTRYPNMSEEAYRARLEMVRDPEVVEQWRKQCTKKKVYRRKDYVAPEPAAAPAAAPAAPAAPAAQPASVAPAAQPAVATASAPAVPPVAAEPAPKAPPLSREAAETLFIREMLPKLIISAKHLVCTAAVGVQTASRPLYYAIKDALNRERRFPASLFFALRGAFRHRKLHLFRVNDARGQDFVMLREPVALNPEHAVPALKEVLDYVVGHPACTKTELLASKAGATDEQKKELLTQLAWLIEKGHVIEFYNGVLSAPVEYPAFHTLPGEKQQQQQPPRRESRPAPKKPAPAPKPAPAQPVAAAPASPAQPAPEAAAKPPAPQPPAAPQS